MCVANHRHLLLGTWFLFWANAVFTFGAFVLLLGAIALFANGQKEQEQIFIWLSRCTSYLLLLALTASKNASAPHVPSHAPTRVASISRLTLFLVDDAV